MTNTLKSTNMVYKLRGRVAACSKLSIAGWALSPDDENHRPEIEVFQTGQVVYITIPNIADAGIRPVLGLSRSVGANLVRWQIMLPFSSGILPDRPFSIRFRESMVALEQGSGLVLPLFDPSAQSARQEIDEFTYVVASYEETGGRLSGTLFIARRDLVAATAKVDGELVGPASHARPVQGGHVLGHPGSHVAFELSSAEGKFSQISADLSISTDSSQAKLDDAACLYVPQEILKPASRLLPLPDAENIRRVAGKVDDLHFLVGGFTQYMHMNALAMRHFGKNFSDFESVCDWGVGCGRILRHFPAVQGVENAAPQRVVGLDIDQYNIDWCEKNIRLASFHMLNRHVPRMPFEDGTIDLLYAISVMTHLSEYNQQLWLSEIRRVVRPGACVILTVNGDTSLYQRPELLQYYFTEKFGFSDLQPDTTFGNDLSSYYRVTYQTHSFIREEWGRLFTILEIFPAKQDYVVMRV